MIEYNDNKREERNEMNLLAFVNSYRELKEQTGFSILFGHELGEPAYTGWEVQLIFVLRVLIAGGLGIIIGIERNRRQKEAGMATHFIVGCAAALFTIISMSLRDIGDGERIAAQIVSGISFLGAGVIFFRRENLRGLTTAAGVWATAAIGMAVGAGMPIVASVATVLILCIQMFLHSKVVLRKSRKHMLFVKFVYSNETKNLLIDHFGCDNFHRFKIYKDGEQMIAEAVIYTKQNFFANELCDLMYLHPDVLSVERLEDL